MRIQLLFLLLLAASCICGWNQEITLVESDTQLAVESVYTSPVSPYYTHVLYLTLKDNGYDLAHSLIDASSVVLTTNILAKNVAAGSLAVDPITEKVLVAFTNKAGELYFVESTDNGWSWNECIKISEPTELPKLNPTLLYQKETGRVFIFYTLEVEHGAGIISMRTRAKDSTIFSAEKRVCQTNIKLNKFAVAYNMVDGNRAKLHLLWGNAVEDDAEMVVNTYYSYSTTQGLVWSEPTLFNANLAYAFMSLQSPNSASRVPGIIVSTGLEKKRSILRYSEDMGNTWSVPLGFDIGYGRETAVCIAEGKTYVFVLMSNIFNTIYERVKIGDEKVTREKSPFDEVREWRYSLYPHLTCYTNGSEIHVSAIVSRFLNDKYFLVINHQDYATS